MAKYICTQSFQCMGTMIKAGQILDLDDGDMADAFVADHVKKYEKGDEIPYANPGAVVVANRPKAGCYPQGVRRGK